MNSRVVVQVPTDKYLKTAAENAAREQGFSSLQEAMRVFMKQISQKALVISFVSNVKDQKLTSKQEAILIRKSIQAKKEIKKGNGFRAQSAEEMIKTLRPEV